MLPAPHALHLTDDRARVEAMPILLRIAPDALKGRLEAVAFGIAHGSDDARLGRQVQHLAAGAQAKGETVEIAPVVEGAAADEGNWLGQEPETPAIDQVIDVDVVVVGAGLSGVCAARAPAEEGASVAVIEKCASFNCRSGEYAVLNGPLNERWGRTNIVDTDVVVNRLMRECTYRNKRAIIKRWADHAYEAMDWFIGAYPELTI